MNKSDVCSPRQLRANQIQREATSMATAATASWLFKAKEVSIKAEARISESDISAVARSEQLFRPSR